MVLNIPEGHNIGISLFGFDTDTGVYISAITPDSVAGKSNQLKIGDQILEVSMYALEPDLEVSMYTWEPDLGVSMYAWGPYP